VNNHIKIVHAPLASVTKSLFIVKQGLLFLGKFTTMHKVADSFMPIIE